MRFLPTTATDVSEFTGTYGNTRRRHGIISEHVPAALRAGLTVRVLNLSAIVVDPSGRTIPILCSELIRVDTEDGPMSGRCGALANLNGVCDVHDYYEEN
jgi:hypothetical protein